MKNRGLALIEFFVIASIIAALCSCQSPRTGEPVSPSHDEQMYGYLYNDDGSPAANAQVVLVASDFIPSALSKKTSGSLTGLTGSVTSAAKVDCITDQNGRYSFSVVPAGNYNVYGQGNGFASYTSSVYISSSTNPVLVKSDTLKATGSIRGRVTTMPPTDSRRIFILAIGGYIVQWPDDSAGNFTIKNIARGTYRLRFLSTDTDFPILDTMVQVFSGKETNLGTIFLTKVNSVPDNYLSMKFGVLLHFNMSTFDRCTCSTCYSVSGEWGLANRDPKIFKPTALDCGQWARAAKSAGCKYMVLTTKHHDGFCLWPSKYTDYCVKNAGVTTDVVAAFADSARAYGLKIGFFYSIRDLTNGYALPFVKGQLTELLTNYGEVVCVWFDGWGWGPGYNAVPYDTIRTLIKSIQPHCMIVENNHEFSTTRSEIVEYEMPIDGPPALSNILQAEGCEPIRLRTTQFEPLWFWHPEGNCTIKSAESIVAQLTQNNSRNANYLLSITPDTTGQLPQCQVDRLKDVGTLRGIK